MRFPSLLTIALSCAALGLSAADAPAPAPGATPPGPHAGEAHDRQDDNKLHRAMKALDEAIEDLKKAPHDFGGHKVAAIEACENAKKQLHEALAFDEKHEKEKGEKEKGEKEKGEKGKGDK